MPKEITQGEINRSNKEQQNKIDNVKKVSDAQSRRMTQLAENEVLGTYKRTVIDSFIKTFDDHYGDGVDYNSLTRALRFSIKNDKNSFRPDFSFDENVVQFKSDAKKQYQSFNENSIQDFLSNSDIIQGNIDIRYEFDNIEEYQVYLEGSDNYSEVLDLDGQFIPASTEVERYGEFNRINKLGGYTPTNESGKLATQEAKQVWDKIKVKILSNVLKKFKL